MRLLLATCAVAAAALALPAKAIACDTPIRPRYQLDEALVGVDLQPPTATGIEAVEVTRRLVPLADDEIPITSCGTGSDKEAAVTVWIRRSEDNYAAPEQIGYRVEIVSGNAPRGLARTPQVVEYGNRLVLPFDDRDDDDVIDFRMRLVPVDTAGNEGPPSEVVHVRHEGVGCSAAGGGAAPLGLLALLALCRGLAARTLLP